MQVGHYGHVERQHAGWAHCRAELSTPERTAREHQQGSGTLCMRNDAECLQNDVPVLNTEIGAVRAEEVALAGEPLTE